MTINYWTSFTKRKNSTSQPTGGTSATVTLKEGTSIEHPTFLLTGNLFACTYVEAFGHYYFVEDVKSVRNGLTEISCSMDVLASFKTDIGNYNAYIDRAADSNYYDVMYPDNMVAIKNEEEVLQFVTSSASTFTFAGLYVLSVLNNLGSGAGFTTYYLMDIGNMKLLANYLNQDWGAGAADLLGFLQANFLHTADSVINCIWVPFSILSLPGGTASETVKIGTDVVVVGGVNCTGSRITGSSSVGHSSQKVTFTHLYSDFRKGAPFTNGKLYIPFYGIVDFNPLDFPNDYIYMEFDCDYATGDVMCYIKDADSSGKTIAIYTYNCAVQCPVGKGGANAEGFATSGLATAASLALAVGSSGAAAVAGGFGAAIAGINTLSNAVVPTASVRGGQGGRATSYSGTDAFVTLICKHTADPMLCVCQGRPVMGYQPISNFTGYVKCLNASVPINGMDSERDAVNDFLNNGFYYE